MDLILMKPGRPGFLDTSDSPPAALDGIDGLSIGEGPFIELVSIHQGMKQQVTTDVANAARTSGRPEITDLTCVKYVDATSVKLYDCCLRAMPLDDDTGEPTQVFILRNTGDEIARIMTISIVGALISGIEFQSHPNDMPTEQFKLNFTEIRWSYDGAEPGGTQSLTSGWSVARNRPVD